MCEMQQTGGKITKRNEDRKRKNPVGMGKNPRRVTITKGTLNG